MKIKSVIRAALFLALLLFVLLTVNSVLMPEYYLANSPWPTTAAYNAFYKMEKNSIDVLFLGSSHCVNAFSPMEIYDAYGIRSFNLGSEQQSIFLSYYWLKEALRFQTPSVVVLEGRFLRTLNRYDPINTIETLTRKCLDPMRWSRVKLEAVRELCALDGSQSIESWFLTNIRFHDRWKGLEDTDFISDSEITCSQLMGWAPGNGGNLYAFEPFTPTDEDQTYELDPRMVEYFGKTADLCKERGIRLVLVDVPADTDAAIGFAVEKLAEKYDVDYIEMSEKSVWEDLMKDEQPNENPVAHGNIWGNLRISRYIGRILKDDLGVPSVTDGRYESKRPFYEHVKNSYRLQETTDIDEYLELLRDDRFFVFIAVCDEAVSGMRDTTAEGLKKLGLEHEWNRETDFRKSYIAVIDDEGITERSGGRIFLSGSFGDKERSYDIVSSGYEDEGESYASIAIDGTEYSKNLRGLNFVVYDTVRRCVADSVNFDTYAGSEARR